MPGEGLAMRLVSLTVAALVQCFEWDVGEGDTIDMAEGGGLTMPMAAAPGVCQECVLCFHLMDLRNVSEEIEETRLNLFSNGANESWEEYL